MKLLLIVSFLFMTNAFAYLDSNQISIKCIPPIVFAKSHCCRLYNQEMPGIYKCYYHTGLYDKGYIIRTKGSCVK